MLAPAVLVAQQGSASAAAQSNATAKAAKPAASANATTSASANAELSIPAKYSAESRARLQAVIQSARAKDLPEEPMQRRIAEGEAKGASEAQVVAAVQKVEARLEATQSAMVRAGRAKPQRDEVARGSQAMEQGATESQIEALVKHAPSDRSLVVAFDVLTKLTARGVPVDNALAQVQSKLDARASDESLNSLVSTANVQGAAHGGVAGSAAAGVNVAGKAAAGVTGAVTGAVPPKKP
jgi:hypothetical protein